MALIIFDPVPGSTTITVQLSGSGGADVVGSFRRAGTNETPTQVAAVTGDVPITFTGLVNRTAYELFAQTKVGTDFGPASNVLLATPFASGTSDYDRIRVEIRSEMLQVSNIGQVHLRRRHSRFWDEFYERHKKDGRLNNWEITRTAREQDVDSPQGEAGTEPFFFDAHAILIRGHMALNEATESETTFQQILDDIVLRIRTNNRLNGAVLLPRQMQVPTIDHETFGGVLCHFSELNFEAIVRVGG